ncbi:hypothetical protein KPH14_013117, partial [Odynerus spinipes]
METENSTAEMKFRDALEIVSNDHEFGVEISESNSTTNLTR